jgi:hypothetical protein
MVHQKSGKYSIYFKQRIGLQNPMIYFFCKGQNGVVINRVVLPRNQQMAIQHMDIINFSSGDKYLYTFRVDDSFLLFFSFFCIGGCLFSLCVYG